MNILRTLVAVVVLSLPGVAASYAEGAEPDVLTLTGKVGTTNRGPLDPFRDAYLAHKDVKFEKAFALTRPALAALPQKTITARAEDWPAAVTLSGPSLEDVLKAAGVAPDATVAVTALDGYTVTLTPKDRTGKAWVLAIAADGKALSIGGRGPVWLIHDTGGATVSTDVEANWGWAAYLIEVQ